MKTAIVLILGLLLCGCVSPPEKLSIVDPAIVHAFGSVQVKMNKDGTWAEVNSTVSAEVNMTVVGAQEAATKQAVAEATRNVTTFLNTTIGYQATNVDPEVSMSDNAAALLKMLVVDQQTVEGNRLLVRVAVKRSLSQKAPK